MEQGPEIEPQVDKFDRWAQTASHLEHYLGTFSFELTPLPEIETPEEEKKQADSLISQLVEIARRGKPHTVILSGPMLDVKFQTLDRLETESFDRKFSALPETATTLNLSSSLLLEVGRRFKVFPRRAKDNYLFKVPDDPIHLGQDLGGISDVIYNVIQITHPSLPRHTYWHEGLVLWGWGSLAKRVAITVNRDYHRGVTTGIKSQIRNAWIERKARLSRIDVYR